MEEKERYELLDDYDIDVIVDNITHSEFTNGSQFCSLLNQQGKRIKELENENQQLKQQLEELEASYNSTMRYLNATRSQLLNLPNKIVEEIRKDMSERIIEKQIKWKDNIQIGFICNVINESLDTILKKYGGEDE